jgi:hypothetical protein
MATSIRLIFTKLPGKMDKLLIEGFGRALAIDCPKQRIIPHDMVHYAVEQVLGLRGFVRLAAEGRPEAELVNADYDAHLGESMVETMQAELWDGKPVEEADFVDLLRITMETRGRVLAPLPTGFLQRLRALITDLTARWEQVPVHGSISLELPV